MPQQCLRNTPDLSDLSLTMRDIDCNNIISIWQVINCKNTHEEKQLKTVRMWNLEEEIVKQINGIDKQESRLKSQSSKLDGPVVDKGSNFT